MAVYFHLFIANMKHAYFLFCKHNSDNNNNKQISRELSSGGCVEQL